MDNVKINISDEKIYIKKGFMKKKYLYTWYFLIIIIILIFLFLSRKENNLVFKNLELLFNKYKLGIIINVMFIISFLGLGFLGFSIYLSLYLEEIEVSNNIKILSPNYKIILTHNNFGEIFITPHYVYKNFRYEKSSFREYFESKCTVIFRTKDDKEYKWGYTLSYQKGMEIKKLIEKKMKEDMKIKVEE